jgi:hypothetical protein
VAEDETNEWKPPFGSSNKGEAICHQKTQMTL